MDSLKVPNHDVGASISLCARAHRCARMENTNPSSLAYIMIMGTG